MSRPETELLLSCARIRPDRDSVARARSLLQTGLDWDYLVRAASRHRVMPLLYRNLPALCQEAIPRTTFQLLQHRFYANAARNLVMAHELLKILHLLEAHGVAAIPYKGPALALSAYGDLTLRQFGDLDILVHKRDGPKALALLVAQGYRLWHPRLDHLLPALYRLRKVYELQRADGQVLVELHWTLAAWPVHVPVDLAQVWARAETITLGGAPVRSLAPEDLLLILCVHGTKHHWSRLGWICDIAELLRARPDLAWEGLLAQARQVGAGRMLLLGLVLAHDLLGAGRPEAIKARIEADPMVALLAAEVCTRLFSDADESHSAVDFPAFYLRLRERRRDRLSSAAFLAYRTLRTRLARLSTAG